MQVIPQADVGDEAALADVTHVRSIVTLHVHAELATNIRLELTLLASAKSSSVVRVHVFVMCDERTYAHELDAIGSVNTAESRLRCNNAPQL